MRVLVLLGLYVALDGCVAAGVTYDCDGSMCQRDAACQGDACLVCPEPATCNAEALCTETLCEGRSYVCSLDGPGHYGWTTTMANCDDGDPCTENDHCIGVSCVGTAMACTTPPAATCVGTGTLRTFALPGQCVGGTCQYTQNDRTCPVNDCAGGTCTGDPCAGVVCDSPPDACSQSPGSCDNGTCTYPPKTLDCVRNHATGGHCVNGACAGWTCDSGWGNCNNSWDDGCEANLKTSQYCGDCNTTCTAGTNATADCSTGTCTRACNGSWKNCDGNWGNGCEIPVGVANRCDSSGLTTTNSCGTAYCGTSTSSNATNFGTWYCMWCSTCHETSAGLYSWCLKPAYHWSSDTCTGCCGSWEDLVCAP